MSSQTKSPLFAQQRYEIILDELQASGRVELAALARSLDVSGETVRKDLAALERQGRLQRVHGGAVQASSLTIEPPVATRTQHRAQKSAIAQAALAHVPDSGAILLDAGSTTSALADLLPRNRPLTIYTNALAIAMSLSDRPNLAVRTLGGQLRSQTMAVVGTTAVDMLKRINVDVAFLGTNGMSLERGFTTPDPAEAAVKTAMLQAAARRIMLADASKFGLVSQCQHCDFDDVDLLITDTQLPQEAIMAISRRGVEVDIVEVSSS